MAPLSRVLAAALAAALVAAPAAAQVKAVPEVAAPVGGGVAGAQPGRAMLGAPGLNVPSLSAPTLGVPAAPAAVIPSVHAAGAVAQAAPVAAQAALALPAAAAPVAQSRASARAALKPPPAAPAKGLEGLRRKTAEMGELLGMEGGGAQAGVQAAGLASSIFDGGLNGAGFGAEVAGGEAAGPAPSRLGAPGPEGSRPADPPVAVPASGPSRRIPAAVAYARFNLRLGRVFYRATGGSFGILPETFGVNSDGDPLIILERKTPPFSQLLPRALRPRHTLSIGVNAAPDLASKKALLKAFAELGSPETLKRLGIGEPGGALGFKVVTENTALVSFAKRFEKDGWEVLPYAQGARALDRAQHWLQHPYASLRRLAERAFGVARPDPRHIIQRDFTAAEPRAPPQPLRLVFNPLAAGEIIVDANIAIALEHQAHGDLQRPEHIAFVRRIGGRTARQPERAFAETRWGEANAVVPIRTERGSPEYRALLAVLDGANVGRAKGASDREIVADAFFAATADGAPAAFYTGDKGIYNTLARLAGHDPAKLGKSVPEAFPEGFPVSIEGKTLLVVPVASR